MNKALVWRLAVRYMRGKGTANAVPVLSRISMIAIAVSSCAMVILFSVFNGFNGLVDQLYRAFYPDIRISATRGKFFTPTPAQISALQSTAGVLELSKVLQDNVLVNGEAGETIPVLLKGVDAAYFSVNDVRPFIVRGDTSLLLQPVPTAIIGQSIAAHLEVDVDNVFSRIGVYYPNTAHKGAITDQASAFRSEVLKPGGMFSVQEEFDGKYLLADIALARSLMQQPASVSSLELKLKPDAAPGDVQETLKRLLGKDFRVETRYEQNRSVYMVMQSEKWAGYAILLFVLLIASFNMIGALSLLVLEKQKDIGILKAMGLSAADTRAVVLLEGLLWSLSGGLTGVVLGLLLCLGQAQFHWVKIQGAFIIDAYPVRVLAGDLLVVLGTVALVGLLAAAYPARRAARYRIPDIMSGK